MSLRIYEKQTAASRGKKVTRDDTQSPDQKAMNNRHNPGWFARPEKFTNDRPTINQNSRSQRGMNVSNGRPASNEGQGQSTRSRPQDADNYMGGQQQIFDEDDYNQMVESDSGNMLRPASPYLIPEQAKLESGDYMRRQTETHYEETVDERRDTPGFQNEQFRGDNGSNQQSARYATTTSGFDTGVRDGGGIKPYQSAGSARSDLAEEQPNQVRGKIQSFGPGPVGTAASGNNRNSFAQAQVKPPNQLKPRQGPTSNYQSKAAAKNLASQTSSRATATQKTNNGTRNSHNEEQGSTRQRRTSSNHQNAARRRSPAGPNQANSAPISQASKEADFIKKKLNSFQQDVISICQEYDLIVQKQVKSRTDYLQSEQFNLIKKAVSTITCLEDLVQISLQKMESSGKEATETITALDKATRENQHFKQQLGCSDAGIEDQVKQLSYDLKGHVDSSLNRSNGDGHLSQLRYRISSRVLANMGDLVDKIENNRYDAALKDTLSALITVYGDPDPICVKQDDMGALNIEVKSQPGVDPIYDDNLFKRTEQECAIAASSEHNQQQQRGKRKVGHLKSQSSGGNSDIAFVSPISRARRGDISNITKDSHPGDETKELAHMVEQETMKKPVVRQQRRVSRAASGTKNVEVLDHKKSRQSQNIVAYGRSSGYGTTQSAKKPIQPLNQLHAQKSDDLQSKKQAIHDVYKQYAQMKQIKDGKRTLEPTITKTQSQKLFTEPPHISSRKNSVKGKTSVATTNPHNQRKTTGLITTQLLKEGMQQPSKSAISVKNNDSNRASKISVYSDNLQFETRTEDGRKTIGQNSAVLTDPKINLFSTQMGPGPVHRTNSMKREVAQNINHQVRASRTPHSHKFKHHGVTSSQPASRRDQDSFIAGESNGRQRGGIRPAHSTNSSRTQSLMSPKDTPKGGRTKKPPVPSHRTLEQFYSGAKDTRGAVNNLFSPVLSNMHKGGGVQVKPQSKVNDSQQTLKISSATKQKGTKLVSTNRRKELLRGSPNKHDSLITPILAQQQQQQQQQQQNSSMLGRHSPRRIGSSMHSKNNMSAVDAQQAASGIKEDDLILTMSSVMKQDDMVSDQQPLDIISDTRMTEEDNRMMNY